MPWEKQFDSDVALGKAMATFWARGYEATSVQDLVDCMGINRGSLYATFGDKRQLFLAALRRYDELYRKAWVAGIAGAKAPRAAILAVFEDAIAATRGDTPRDGCLLVNTALELSPHDPEISQLIANSFAEMESFLQDRLEAGRQNGTIPARVDPAETAAALLSLFLGLRVLARSRPDQRQLRAIAGRAEALIS